MISGGGTTGVEHEHVHEYEDVHEDEDEYGGAS